MHSVAGNPRQGNQVVVVWADFGFVGNPYSVEPIPPSAEGDQLLVGRSAEISALENRIVASGTHPTLEGDNGVGKTSLISVVCYRLRTDTEQGRISKVFLPVHDGHDESFQLQPDDSPDLFIRRVYLRIASTIIAEHSFLKKLGRRVPDIREVDEWLNSPTVKGWGAGLSVLGSGGQISRTRSLNSSGFSETGLLTTVDRWLRHLFPSPQTGGFVCVIDNLELLETTQRARTVLEALRDPLLSRRGLRWILCGARGIVRTSAASPRLEGRLAEPMEIEPISDRYVEAAVDKRINQYAHSENAKAPVGPQSFRHLYDVLNRNLRQAFKYAEDFSFWLYQQKESAADPSSYDPLFQVWLTTRADMHNDQTDLGKRAWDVFDQLAERGGWCSPSDFRSFGFNSAQVMRPHIKALESENLVTTSLNDENDKRRKTIFMTARGWLVRYARCGYKPPTTDRAIRVTAP
jgi:hypothetical protein